MFVWDRPQDLWVPSSDAETLLSPLSAAVDTVISSRGREVQANLIAMLRTWTCPRAAPIVSLNTNR